MVDIVESLVLQELSSRMRERRSNATANIRLLRNPRQLNNVISTMGAELLTDTQIEGINKDVFRRDPVTALDSAFNEADPRRGSLVKIRTAIRKFISNPRNQTVSPEKIFATAFRSEQERATPELTRLFKEKGFFGGAEFEPDKDIRFPSSIGIDAAAQTLLQDPGSFGDVAVAALKGAVQAPIDNFAINVGFGAVAAGVQNRIAARARRGVRGRTSFGRGIQKSALQASGRKHFGVRALTALGRGLNFIPTLPTRAAAGILIATVAGLSAFEARFGAVEEGLEEASPGFANRNPGAHAILTFGAGAANIAVIKSLTKLLTERRVLMDKFQGTAEETINLNKVGQEIKSQSGKLSNTLETLAAEGKKISSRKTRQETGKLGEELFVAEAGEESLLNTARGIVKGIRSQSTLRSRVTGKSIPLAEGGGVLRRTTATIIKDATDDIAKVTRLLPAGPTQKLITSKAQQGKILLPESTKRADAALGKLETFSVTKILSRETSKSLSEEAKKIRGVGKIKIVKQNKSEVVEITKTAEATTIKSAGDAVENSSNIIRERVRIMTDDLIPAATKVEFNKVYTDMIKKGFSEGAAAKVIVEMGTKFKATINTKSASEIFENAAAKLAKRKTKHKPKKTKPEQRFEVSATDELDKVLADGAAKIGKTTDDLTLPEFESIIKASGKTFGILATAIAAGFLLPDDSEASVIKVLGKVASTVAEKAESQALLNASKRMMQKKNETNTQFIERILKETNRIPSNTINSSERRASTLTFNAKREGLNLDKETARRSTLNPIDRAFGSVFNNFRSMGRVGQVLANKFIQVDDFSEIAAKAISKAFKESLPVSSLTGKIRTNLTKQEGKVIHDLLTGATTRGQRELVNVSIRMRSVMDDVWKFAEANGVPVVGYRQNYFPQIIKEGVLNTDKGRAILMNHLINTGQVSTLDEAFAVSKHFIRDRFHNVFNVIPKKSPIKIAGRLEKSRRYDIPPELYIGGDGKNMLEALAVYSHQVTLRVGRIRSFGVKNEKLEPLIKKLKQQGQDERYIRDAVNVMLDKKPEKFKAGEKFKAFTGISRAIETIDLLGYAGISQMAQITFTLAKAGPINTFRGIRNVLFDKKTKEMVNSTAAVADTMSKYILEQFGTATGAGKKAAETALRLYGVLGIDRFGRTLASAAGGEYAMSLARTLAKVGIRNTPASKLVQRQLRELDLIPAIMLRNMKNGKQAFTDNNLRVAMKRMSDMTQFRSRPGDLPLWFSSDHAKLITQFKSFLFQSGSAINQILVKEARQGNLTPLMTALSVSPFIGAGVQEIRQSLKELAASTAGESTKDVGKFRKAEIKKGKFFTEPRNWMGGQSISRVWNDATYTLALGVLPDLASSLLERKDLNRVLLGPSVDRVGRALTAIYDTITEQDMEHVVKELKRLTPLGLNQ